MSKPMRVLMHLDWSDITCPCGATICTRFMDMEQVNRWYAEHTPHTDGKGIAECSADGARVHGGVIPPPETFKLGGA